jgi:hypothetical protein
VGYEFPLVLSRGITDSLAEAIEAALERWIPLKPESRLIDVMGYPARPATSRDHVLVALRVHLRCT